MTNQLPLHQFLKREASDPNKPFLHQPTDGAWRTYSWSEVGGIARRIANGLSASGLEQGDRVAILGKNSAEWVIADLAIMMAGMISVPVYATAGASVISYVLAHSDAKAIFLGKLDDVGPANQAVSTDMMRITFPCSNADSDLRWNDWLTKHEPLQELHDPMPDDIFSIVYTSGSTGSAKGVVLTNANVAASAGATNDLAEFNQNDRLFSYLPLAHITERCVIELPALYSGAQMYFNDTLESFISDLQHARPTVFLSVPRLWSKFQAQILAKLPLEQLKAIFTNPEQAKGVISAIKQGMGLDQVRLFASGTAPISKSILDWYNSIDIKIGEGWGMTETSGLSCGNLPFMVGDVGTIGRPLNCVEMKLSGTGEVMIRGEAVFSQYYKNPEATAEAFENGWFRTGDKGELTADGAFKIVGRIKEQFKTAKGKYVDPVPLESLLTTDVSIEQACVMGLGLPQPVAVLVPSAGDIDQTLMKRVADNLEQVNAQLENHEKLSHVLVASEPWTTENSLLTPTLKLLRDRIEDKYEKLLTGTFHKPVLVETDL